MKELLSSPTAYVFRKARLLMFLTLLFLAGNAFGQSCRLDPYFDNQSNCTVELEIDYTCPPPNGSGTVTRTLNAGDVRNFYVSCSSPGPCNITEVTVKCHNSSHGTTPHDHDLTTSNFLIQDIENDPGPNPCTY